MHRRSSVCRSLSAILVGGLLIFGPSLLAKGQGTDDAIETQRKLASRLFKEGKAGDALAVIREVAKSSDAGYGDFLLLGRIYDRLNRPLEAAGAYRRVLQAVPAAATANEPRSAR